MKRLYRLLLLITLLFVLNANVNAINSDSPVYSDMSYSACVAFQDSVLYTTGSGHFGHCIKTTCYSGIWQQHYYISENMVVCTNGNKDKYTQLVRTGCSGYSGSCTPATKEKYCSLITYYDCGKTKSGMPFTPPPGPPPLIVTTKPTTSIITTKPKPITPPRPTYPRPPVTTAPEITIPPISEEKSSNNLIKSLLVENVAIDFNQNLTEYTIQLNEEITSLNIIVELEDEKSNFEITNNIDINRELPVVITVIAEDESVKVYNINIKEKEAILDNRAKLKELIIKGFSIKFDPEVLTYNITIKNQKSLDIIATPESELASYFLTGNNNLKNKSKIYITVTAEDSSETVYVINIKKTSNIANIAIVIIIVGMAGFVGFKLIRNITQKEKVTSYEYE